MREELAAADEVEDQVQAGAWGEERAGSEAYGVGCLKGRRL
jgi:hypothetical protein